MCGIIIVPTTNQKETNMATKKAITLYSFSELSKAEQVDIIIDCREDDSFLDYETIEQDMIRAFENEAAIMGIQDFKFKYSGFGTRCSGASFTGTLTQALAVKILENASGAKDWAEAYGNKIDVNVHRNNSMYVHHNTVECDYHYDYNDLEISAEDYERITIYFNSWKDSLCHEFYNRLVESYEALTSEENIIQLLNDLGDVYTRNGTILHVSDCDEDEEEEDNPFPHGDERYYYK
jgi:hypothetical protein